MSGNFILGALAGAALNDAYEHVKAEVTGEQVIDHNLVVNHAILHLLDKLVTETMRAASPLNLEDKYYTVHLSSTNPYFVATRRAKHLSLWTATAVSVDVISPVGTTTIALQVGWNPLDFVDGTALKLHTGGPTDIDVQVALTAELLNILYPPSSGGGGGTLTDRSGTITTGGTAQQLAPVNVTRRYLFVENVGTAILWINFTTTAVQSQPSIEIPAGYSFVMEDGFVSTELISIIGPTTGQAFTAKEA